MSAKQSVQKHIGPREDQSELRRNQHHLRTNQLYLRKKKINISFMITSVTRKQKQDYERTSLNFDPDCPSYKLGCNSYNRDMQASANIVIAGMISTLSGDQPCFP
jgi:hypothetical protein